MISKTYIYLNLSLGLSSALDCFTRILTCDSHNHLEGQVPYCPISREGCCSQKLDTCPRSLQAEKQTSVSIPNSRTGALNPPTLPLDTVTTSRLIRPAWTAKLSYVWQSQSHFFVKQRPLLTRARNLLQRVSAGLSGSNFHAQSLHSKMGGPEGNTGVYQGDRKGARTCTQAGNRVRNHKKGIKLTETKIK